MSRPRIPGEPRPSPPFASRNVFAASTGTIYWSPQDTRHESH